MKRWAILFMCSATLLAVSCKRKIDTGSRVAAFARRMKSTEDNGMEHVGFRCVENR